MIEGPAHSAEFWDGIEPMVAERSGAALRGAGAKRKPVIAYLRHGEELARTECDRWHTVPIIASGRSLLGDRRPVGPEDGPFARASQRQEIP